MPKLMSMRNREMFDVEKFPTATYKGTLAKFKDGAPTESRQVTLHVSRSR